MGSQFVDLNADGHLDYLSATFDGSPHIAWGSAEGFAPPVRIKDKKGRRLLIGSYWDYEKESHLDVSRALPEGGASDQRCISAAAMDWDGDGDQDILLGSYENGHIYLQLNEGTNEKFVFSGMNTPVLAAGQPIQRKESMTSMRVIDWDADGDEDLVFGIFSAKGQSSGGKVLLHRNVGTKGKPKFAAAETLLKASDFPEGPQAGFYPEVVDWDQDGDLDLIVGGKCKDIPKTRVLSDKEEARAKELRQQLLKLNEELQQFYQKAFDVIEKNEKGLKKGTAEHRKWVDSIWRGVSKDSKVLTTKITTANNEYQQLVPQPKERNGVWFFERVSSQS